MPAPVNADWTFAQVGDPILATASVGDPHGPEFYNMRYSTEGAAGPTWTLAPGDPQVVAGLTNTEVFPPDTEVWGQVQWCDVVGNPLSDWSASKSVFLTAP